MSPEQIRYWGFIFLLVLLVIAPTVKADFMIGTGKADITGAAADSGMMCYAEKSQTSTGINDRQWARAFIIADNESDHRVAFVVIDAGAMFSSVFTAVDKILRKEFKGLYGQHNIIISATHTHSAVAGQSHHFLYNMPHGIFDPLNFQMMVNGIVQSIRQAHNSLAPGKIFFNSGDLLNASANRSREAYLSNEDANDYDYDIDPLMQVMRLERQEKPAGAIAWFATHGVSYPKTNTLLSSDNKGFAAWLFEQHIRSTLNAPDFVAAFPQTNAGDMTPNLNLDGTGPGSNPEENVRIIGFRQFKQAKELHEQTEKPLTGGIKIRHHIIDFPKLLIEWQYTGKEAVHPCEPAMGYSFAAGTEDGRPYWVLSWLLGAREGSAGWSYFTETLKKLLVYDDSDPECHKPKPVLLPLGHFKNYSYFHQWLPPGNLPAELLNLPWAGNRVSITIARIGPLTIVALPFEITVMAGRRLKDVIAQHTPGDPSNIIIAGYSNDYLSYLTTPEEYDAQHYEGASNIFGRWSLSGLQQIIENMFSDINGDSPPGPQGTLEDLSFLFEDVTMPDIYDSEHLTKPPGTVLVPPSNIYSPGEKVVAEFISGHPRNAAGIIDSFILVQRWNLLLREWQTIATDDSWSTRFLWLGNNRARIEWQTSFYQPDGIYRIIHRGVFRLSADTTGEKSLTPFTEDTYPFQIKSPGSIGNAFEHIAHFFRPESSATNLLLWYAPPAHEPESRHPHIPTLPPEEHHELFGL